MAGSRAPLGGRIQAPLDTLIDLKGTLAGFDPAEVPQEKADHYFHAIRRQYVQRSSRE